MFRHELAIQTPANPGVAINAVEAVASSAEFDRLRAAFAYATAPGAQELIDAFVVGMGEDWTHAEKRWLISADFGFTEPEALKLLAGLPRSRVRSPTLSISFDATYVRVRPTTRRVCCSTGSPVINLRSGCWSARRT